MANKQLSLALNQCTSHRIAAFTQAIHSNALKTGIISNLHVATRILTAYCKCGVTIHDARQLFDELRPSLLDVVCWNSIISGCVQNGRDEDAFQYFKLMQSYYRNHNSADSENLGSDSYTLSGLLSSNYCLEKNFSLGEQLHGYAIVSGIISSLSVGNALITLYSRWSKLHESRLVFEHMPNRNVVTWTALISGHAQQRGGEEESFRLFVVMMREKDQRPNQFTFASVLGLCGRLASFSQGKMFVVVALKMGFLSDIHVQNSLVGFYSECGWLDEAQASFDAINNPDLVSWNSLLKGYSQQGRGKEALKLFEEMQKRNVNPDTITFLSTMSACRHSGMISQGLELFKCMKQDHGIEAQSQHISCIVDLLGRAGQLHQAEKFVRGIQFELSPSVWRTLLGACRVHGQAKELAELAASKLLKLDPSDTEAHIVLSHIYAASGQWDMVANLRRSFKEKGMCKEPGYSWIEVGNRVHSFVAADWGHPLINNIQTMLMLLTNHMKECILENPLDWWRKTTRQKEGPSLEYHC